MTIPIEKVYSSDWHSWRDPDVPEYVSPTHHLLDKHLGTPVAKKTALQVDEDSYSYEELQRWVCRAANGLAALGMDPENRLLLFGTDSLEYLSVWMGALRIGAVPAVVSDLYKGPMLLYFLQDTAAKVLFLDEEQVPKLEEIAPSLPATLRCIVVRAAGAERPSCPASIHAKWVIYDELVASCADTCEPVLRHANDMAYMFYSGGTTGTAKGIVHLALDFLLIPHRHGAFWEYTAQDVCYATSKKYFTHGLWPGVLIPLSVGATVVISRDRPTPQNVLKTMKLARPTVLVTVPTVVNLMLLWLEESGESPDFSHLRLAVTASEKIPADVFEQFRQRFGIELHDSIGSSEVTYEWIANRPREFKPGSLGKPVFGFEVKLVDEDGSTITEPGTDGEAWVKSQTAGLYYWRKLDKTKETFVGPWTRTGDILRFDEDGFFWFSSRKDDVFKVKGLWVSPIEVEAAIVTHPLVLEAAVIPFEPRDGLTQVMAFVALTPGERPTPQLTEALENSVRALGSYKVPRVIEYVESLPRTTLSKIDRRALREQVKNR